MVRIKPFEAIRPPAPQAPRVSSPPYDVIDTSEARALADGNPDSFLHVIRPEIDLPDDTNPYDDSVYQAAAAGLQQLMTNGALARDNAPGLFLYRQTWNGRSQTGLVCCCHVDDYRKDVIRKHEKTRADKEDDRTRHVLSLDAHTGPVFLTYRDQSQIDTAVADDSTHRPLYHFVTPDGVTHTAWSIRDPHKYVNLFESVPLAYVADGHHRSASAERAAAEHQSGNNNHDGTEEYNWFLSVLFPASQLSILPYNRFVGDLNGHTESELVEALRRIGELLPTDEPMPDRPGSFGVHLGGQWYTLCLDEGSIDWADPIGSLDVSLLQDRVLGPLLGIQDPRVDSRIKFIGGIRGIEALECATEQGGIAFAMTPTSIDQLLSVADAGQCMPPKSTWFEPKLRSGLFIHALDTRAAVVS
ncbi:MAG: DUF1015 family protein [Phycisphaerales bacterium]|nr:DUF1015 family protein [Phycisphaerales bacterium]